MVACAVVPAPRQQNLATGVPSPYDLDLDSLGFFEPFPTPPLTVRRRRRLPEIGPLISATPEHPEMLSPLSRPSTPPPTQTPFWGEKELPPFKPTDVPGAMVVEDSFPTEEYSVSKKPSAHEKGTANSPSVEEDEEYTPSKFFTSRFGEIVEVYTPTAKYSLKMPSAHEKDNLQPQPGEKMEDSPPTEEYSLHEKPKAHEKDHPDLQPDGQKMDEGTDPYWRDEDHDAEMGEAGEGKPE
jgi:hypothetical protein